MAQNQQQATPATPLVPLTPEQTQELKGLEARARELWRSSFKAYLDKKKMKKHSKTVGKGGALIIFFIFWLWLGLLHYIDYSFDILPVIGVVLACMGVALLVLEGFRWNYDRKGDKLDKELEEVRAEIHRLRPRPSTPTASSYGAVNEDPNILAFHHDPDNQWTPGHPYYPDHPYLNWPILTPIYIPHLHYPEEEE